MISLLAVFTLSPPLSVCHREILQVVMKVKTGHQNVWGGGEGEGGVTEEERCGSPLTRSQPACVVLCCVVFGVCLCACAHGPAVFSFLSVSLRLPAGRMRREERKRGGGGKVE